MNYSKKYQTLKAALQNQPDVVLRAKLDHLAATLDKEVANGKKTAKQAFFMLLQNYLAFDLKEVDQDNHKKILDSRLKVLDIDGKNLEQSTELEFVNLISEDDDLFIFLCKNAEPLLSKRVLNGILNTFFYKKHEDEEAALKRTSWLIGVALYQMLQNAKNNDTRVRIQRILIGYFSHKTYHEDIENAFERLKDLNVYFSIDDIIFYRMTDKAKEATQHGPYQDTFLDVLRDFVGGHQSHVDITNIRKYDKQFKVHAYRFIEMIKLLYKELSHKEKFHLREFVQKLHNFDKEVRQLNVILGLKGNPLGGISVLNESQASANESIINHLNAAAESLLQEAHQLFDRCIPGTISYHILALSLFVVGVGLVATGILALALLPTLGVAALGAVSFYSLAAGSIASGYACGLFSAVVLSKARRCVETSTVITNAAISVIEHGREDGEKAALRLDLSTQPPEDESENAELGKLEDPTNHSLRFKA